MKKIQIRDARELVKTYGRSFFEEESGILYSNYTCGGFEFVFSGCLLTAEFDAIPDTMVPPQRNAFPGQEPPKREDWPYLAVVLDDGEEPVRKICVKKGEPVVLYFSETPETHKIRLVKLTENFRTALGLVSLTMDGELLPYTPEKKEIIEFIGDSITCGFGNATGDVGHEFAASEEDGWMTHGAIAARALGMEPRFVSVSGISVETAPGMPGMYCMRDLYPYTDRILEDKLAERKGTKAEAYQPFDFAGNQASIVVLNLGTNDANQIYFSPDQEAAEERFQENYYRFVSEIRQLNGPDTTILCALGCMDYYLFDKICAVVERIKAETGDTRIHTLKYHKMMNIGPDAGACLHPAIFRHKKMADDLVKCIRSL